MRQMLLSFKPEIFDLIRSGKKIFEYRYQFSEEEVQAYMYVSKPVQQIVGCVHLGKKISLLDWKERYCDDKRALKRRDEYMERNNNFVMPIYRFSMTETIPLSKLKQDLDKFIIPQSYYYLDNFVELQDYIKKCATYTGEVIENKFDNIKSEDICKKSY